MLIAHRPGFVAPTQAARKLATLEHLTGEGRVAIHHITGGSDTDQARDGDFVDKDSRYRRTAEFMEVLRRTFDVHRAVLRSTASSTAFEGAISSVRPLRSGQHPAVLRRPVRPGDRGRRRPGRRVRAVGRAAGRHGRAHRADPRVGRPPRPRRSSSRCRRGRSSPRPRTRRGSAPPAILDAAQAPRRRRRAGPARDQAPRLARTSPSAPPVCGPRPPRRTSTTSACSSASPG